jgi:hypothetical protein
VKLDSRIQSVLHQEASTVEAPWPPPLDDLRDAGETEVRRLRVRRRLVGVLAASLVIALPAGILLTDRADPTGAQQDKSPVARTSGPLLGQLSAGASPESLYCLDGVAHWGNQELPLGSGACDWPNRFAEAGGSAAVVDSTRSTVNLFTDRGRVQVPGRADSESSPVVFSPDGSMVAWVSRARVDGRQEIVLWDPVRGVELNRTTAPTADMLNLEGIDGSGRVYMTSVGSGTGALADRIWLWPSGQDGGFRRVVGLGDFVTVADVPPDGLAVLKTLAEDGLSADARGPAGRAVWGTVTERGEFVALGPEAGVRPLVWSPDRSRYVAIGANTVVSRTSRGDGDARRRLRLPSDVSVVGSPSWESSGMVLVPVASDTTAKVAILRCSAGTGRCEVAATGQRSVALPGGDADNMG